MRMMATLLSLLAFGAAGCSCGGSVSISNDAAVGADTGPDSSVFPPIHIVGGITDAVEAVSYTHLTLPTNREV